MSAFLHAGVHAGLRYHQRACRCPRYHQHACRPPGLLTPAMYLILSTSLTVCFSLNQFSFFSSFFLASLSFLCPFFLLCPLPFFSFSFFLSPLLTCMQNSLAACKHCLRAWALCRTLIQCLPKVHVSTQHSEVTTTRTENYASYERLLTASN